jgi:NAD(P)-dependent dehydrogenase (short-subunit alcohol dehydrogenase family)
MFERTEAFYTPTTPSARGPGLRKWSETRPGPAIDDAEHYGIDRGAFKRAGQPDDIVGAALFLAGEGSNYITGQTLVVDGGRQFI